MITPVLPWWQLNALCALNLYLIYFYHKYHSVGGLGIANFDFLLTFFLHGYLA